MQNSIILRVVIRTVRKDAAGHGHPLPALSLHQPRGGRGNKTTKTSKGTHRKAGRPKDIFDYIALDNVNAAKEVVDSIYKKVQELNRFPKIGHRYEDVAEREVRILLYGHYRIAYLIKPNDDIDILGVFHGALDIHRYLI